MEVISYLPDPGPQASRSSEPPKGSRSRGSTMRVSRDNVGGRLAYIMIRVAGATAQPLRPAGQQLASLRSALTRRWCVSPPSTAQATSWRLSGGDLLCWGAHPYHQASLRPDDCSRRPPSLPKVAFK